MTRRSIVISCLAALLCVMHGGERLSAAPTDLRATPGEFLVDHPTLINLGFEWVIDGDANRNATVEVSYRKQGDAAWKPGMPLLRLQGERIYPAERLEPRVAEHVRRQHPRPRAGHGVRGAVRA